MLILSESCNDHAETAETEVDFFALSESFAFSPCDSDSFRTGQIDEIQLGNFELFVIGLILNLPHLFDGDDKDSMRARGGFIHVGPSSGSGLGSDFHEFENFLRPDDCPLRDAFDVNAFAGVFSDL
jgi:hypothetical protein